MISAAIGEGATSTNWGAIKGFGRLNGVEIVNKYCRRGNGLMVEEKNRGGDSGEEETRVCVDCQASKTPLWRSGPRGPKSLCNACGIRYRKRRRRLLNGEEDSEQSQSSKGTATKEEILSSELLSAEELKRRQKEKQQRMLLLLTQQHKREEGQLGWGKREEKKRKNPSWVQREERVGEGKEERDAAFLLLSLSSGILFHS